MNYASNALGAQLGMANAPATVPRDLGLIERSIGVVTGLQSLHSKMSTFRDRVEGCGVACGAEAPTPAGLTGQLSEMESVLRACHSLLDDIAGKF